METPLPINIEVRAVIETLARLTGRREGRRALITSTRVQIQKVQNAWSQRNCPTGPDERKRPHPRRVTRGRMENPP